MLSATSRSTTPTSKPQTLRCQSSWTPPLHSTRQRAFPQAICAVRIGALSPAAAGLPHSTGVSHTDQGAPSKARRGAAHSPRTHAHTRDAQTSTKSALCCGHCASPLTAGRHTTPSRKTTSGSIRSLSNASAPSPTRPTLPASETASRRIYLASSVVRPERIYEALRDDAADLGLVSYPESSREIAAIPWREEEMQVAVPPNHPLAMRAEVYPADLNGSAFIGFDEDLRIRRELDRFLRAQGVEVNLIIHFDNIQMIKEAVALGQGISILPARTMQAEIEQGRLVAVKLNAPGLARPLGIVHRRRKKFNRATERLLAMLMASPV